MSTLTLFSAVENILTLNLTKKCSLFISQIEGKQFVAMTIEINLNCRRPTDMTARKPGGHLRDWVPV